MSIHSARGNVAGIAVRTSRMGPMREIAEAVAMTGAGLDEDLRVSRRRGLTLISAEGWEESIRELDSDLPWYSRRANVLVEGFPLEISIGKTLSVGEVTVKIHGETEPCPAMDEVHPGLQEALRPNLRAGVYGEILQGGAIRVGDSIAFVD
ncbi:MAG: hypothetical protein AMXMBFR82_53850 [Candidatus Hydrogenedentota bacterium]